jgi:hypothetical protein
MKSGALDEVMNSGECIEEADADPYFSPLAEKELLPSSFYFMQLSQVLALSLSISLTYLGRYQYAWYRFAFNSATILGLLTLLFTTKPYRRTERFSAHVQISLLIVSYLVTFTGFTEALSSPEKAPSILIGTDVNATANTAYLKPESVNPLMARLTTVLSYLTLTVMCVVMVFLAFSFFDALKTGAVAEEEMVPSSMFKMGSHTISKGRVAIYSLASVLQNQERGSKYVKKSGFQACDKILRQGSGSGTSIPNPRLVRQVSRFKSVQKMNEQNADIRVRRLQMPGESLESAFLKNAQNQVVWKDKTSEGSFAPMQSRPTSRMSHRESNRTAIGVTQSGDDYSVPRMVVAKTFSTTNEHNGPLASLSTNASVSSASITNPFWRPPALD